MNWIYLVTAILGEVIATSSLKAADGCTKIVPTMISFVGYAAAFFFLSLALKHIAVGIAYAIWAGIGIILISLVGFFYYKQALDAPSLLGIALIMAGVIIINLFSKSVIR